MSGGSGSQGQQKFNLVQNRFSEEVSRPCFRVDRGRENLSSPSLRTGRADFPHPALQLVGHLTKGLTDGSMGCAQREQPKFRKEGMSPAGVVNTLSIQLNHCPPLTPCLRAVNIRAVQNSGSTQLHRARMSLACLVTGDTAASSSSVLRSIPVFHFPASLGSTPITALLRYYGRCDSSAGSPPDRGLPDSCTWPSCHSVSNHLCRPSVAFSRYPSARWTSSLQRSGLRLRLAGSPQTPAESSLSSYGLAVHSL
jgi:hypothetical protein